MVSSGSNFDTQSFTGVRSLLLVNDFKHAAISVRV